MELKRVRFRKVAFFDKDNNVTCFLRNATMIIIESLDSPFRRRNFRREEKLELFRKKDRNGKTRVIVFRCLQENPNYCVFDRGGIALTPKNSQEG